MDCYFEFQFGVSEISLMDHTFMVSELFSHYQATVSFLLDIVEEGLNFFSVLSECILSIGSDGSITVTVKYRAMD